jgi:hypothetical protein
MNFPNLQYISDQHGNPTGVIVPLDLWKEFDTFFKAKQTTSTGDAWEVLESLIGTVEAPSDWASQHDHYLYGTPKFPQEI